MQFNSLSEIIAMGGYGAYVWSSVLIVLLVVAIITVDSMTGQKRILTKIKQDLERAEKIKQAKQSKLSQ